MFQIPVVPVVKPTPQEVVIVAKETAPLLISANQIPGTLSLHTTDDSGRQRLLYGRCQWPMESLLSGFVFSMADVSRARVSTVIQLGLDTRPVVYI